MQNVIDHIDRSFARWQHTLCDLTRIPGVSAAGVASADVRRSAVATADVLRFHGIGDVRLLEVDGAHPSVYGSRLVSRALPTVLIYGHHDVQPAGAVERWSSPPFEPIVRDGRLYGRGTSDDKGGFLAHVAAVTALLECDSLPCNVKFVIEGEEEIGSPHLGEMIERHRDLLTCQYVVLCDTPNFATGVPALTYRLRGNVVVDVEVRCLERPVHSGKAGGLVPDPVQILCSLIARLRREDGSVVVPSMEAAVDVDDAQLAAMRALPFDAGSFRRDNGLLDGVTMPADRPWERLWARPSLTVTAFEASSIAGASNQILDRARARLSLRIVPRIDPARAAAALMEAVTSDVPSNAIVETRVISSVPSWESDPAHPLFAVARRALERGFGSPAVMIGSGGSIGFVQPFATLLGGTPPLLTGVQDPASNAHSEDESLHLGDWRRSMHAAAYLYDELGKA